MLFLLFVLLIVAAVLFFKGYNKLQTASQSVKETASNIDVMLRKKLELTQQIMDVCKGYADHEKLVHFKISADQSDSLSELAAANGQADKAFAYFSQLANRFPDLKASTNFQQLSSELVVLGNELQNKREQYNSRVSGYNQVRNVVPTVFVARALSFPEAKHLDLGDSASMDVLKTFQTDDGAKLEAFLGNIGHKVASGTRAAVGKAAEVGTVVAQKARTGGTSAVEFGRDRLGLTKFRYSEGGVVKGPITRKELDALVEARKLSPQTFVLEEDAKDWVKYESLLAKVAPPPPPDAAIPPPPDRAMGSPGV